MHGRGESGGSPWLHAGPFFRGYLLILSAGPEATHLNFNLCREVLLGNQEASQALVIFRDWGDTNGKPRGLEHVVSFPNMAAYKF